MGYDKKIVLRTIAEKNSRFLLSILRRYLAPGATLLELNMGVGTDLELLKQYYQVTGSDSSQVFLNLYQRNNPTADILLVDVVNMELKRKFNAIFSNKVLNSLTEVELKKSLVRQRDVLTSEGIAFHALWHADAKNVEQDDKLCYYTEETIIKIAKNDFNILEIEKYSTVKAEDSFYFVLRKKK